MATLQKIRNKAVFLTLIIGFALFAFIIGDFLNSGSSLFRQSRQKIAVIGNSSLDYKEYEAKIEEMEEVYKIQTGQSNFDENVSGQIRESVYETIVRERLLDQQAEKLGVAVTGKEVFNMINGANVHPMIRQLPIFQNPKTGTFDRTMMINFLRTIQQDDLSQYPADAQAQIKSLKTYWLFWENNLKYSRLEEKINTLLAKAVSANSLDIEDQFKERSLNVDFAFVCKPYNVISDSLFSVSNSELKKRYNEKKEFFAQKPYRSAKYILVNVAASKEDLKAVEDKINSIKDQFATTTEPVAFANSNSDEVNPDCYVANTVFNPTVKAFLGGGGAIMQPVMSNNAYYMARVVARKVAPDSVKARQIVLPMGAQVKADSILKVLRSGGDFAAIAAKVSGGNPSDMGWFREIDAQQLGPDFLNACFSASKNSYFSVKTKYDIRIMQVTEQTKPVAKTKLALITLNITPSSTTYSKYYNNLNRIVAQNQSTNTLFKAAKKAGYEVQQAQFVRKNDLTLAQIPQMRQAVRFIYNGKVGNVSGILENSSNQFVVVGITAVSDGDYQTFEEAKPMLMHELVNEKKAEKMIQDINAKKPATLAQLSLANHSAIDTARFVNFSVRRIAGVGEEPALVAAVTSAKSAQLSAPVKGKNGVYVFQVLSKTKSGEAFNPQAERMNWNANNMYRIMYQAFDAVRKASKVVDNRIRFY